MGILHENNISENVLKGVHLKYVYEEPPGYTRIRRGKGFSYVDDSLKPLKNPQDKERLIGLAIPPSYEQVWYCPLADGHLQATGYDSNNNKQYFYHENWEYLRTQTKFQNMQAFGVVLPKFRRKVSAGLREIESDKETVLAAMGRILDKTGMRIGSESATAKNKTHGLTTLNEAHVETEQSKIEFQFTGKGGVDIERSFSDAKLVQAIEQCEDIPGQRLFEYIDAKGDIYKVGSSQVNQYIKDIIGDDFSAKDFRTWNFSCLFLEAALRQRKREEKITIKGILEDISALTGNTPSVLQSSYVHPGLIEIVKNEEWDLINQRTADISLLRQTEAVFLNYLDTSHARDILMPPL